MYGSGGGHGESPLCRARLVSPAVLYNATTVASLSYEAHPPNRPFLKLCRRTSENAVKAKFENMASPRSDAAGPQPAAQHRAWWRGMFGGRE
jgi:hypothetical protein